MSQAASFEVLARYVPELVVRRLASAALPLTLPALDEFPAAVLFADISGFTALTERLSGAGPAGAEELTRIVNSYFSKLIEVITAHGGDVVKFAGDALIAVWRPGNSDDTAAILAQRATQCAVLVQTVLTQTQVGKSSPLSLKICVGVGDMRFMHLGGERGRCELLLAGEPLADLGAAGALTTPGQVVLTPSAGAALRAVAKGETLAGGFFRVTALSGTLPIKKLPQTPGAPGLAEALTAYVPAAVRTRLEAGQTEWLAELRPLSVLFVNLPDLTFRTPLARAQQAMVELQRTLYRFEGSINKLSVDDKGVTLVAAMGLPPLAHEDDPVRAVRAALSIHKVLKAMGWFSSIGVTSGRAFCGAYGSSIRREYTMIGDMVNLSARLMQAAKEDILCDSDTWRAAQEHVLFERLEPIHVKGKTENIHIYRPRAATKHRRPRTLKSIVYQQSAGHKLVGRLAEREKLAKVLKELLVGQPRSALIIDGETGIGKSQLVADTVAQAEALGLVSLGGAGDPIERNTPFYAFRPVLRQILQIDGDDPDKIRENVEARFASDPDLADRGPLLGTVLGIEWPDNPATRPLVGPARAEEIEDLILELLMREAATMPLLIVMDNGQWIDPASWGLIRVAARDVHPALVVLSTRPMTEQVPEEYVHLVADPGTMRITLEALSNGEAATLLADRLGVSTVPRPITALVQERAGGHPLFIEQMAAAVAESGLLRIEDGKAELVSMAADMSVIRLPETLEGIVTSRIDRLTLSQQLALKVASVIGRVFTVSQLVLVFPLQDEAMQLPEYLQNLVRLDLIQPEGGAAGQSFAFKHNITQNVAYNLMLVGQREQLHQKIAEVIERLFADDLTRYYSLLAHHWSCSGSSGRAIESLERAADQALRAHATGEALSFLARAKQIADQPGITDVSPLRRARWERCMAEITLEMGNLARSQKHADQVLVLLDAKAEAGTWSRMGRSLKRMISRSGVTLTGDPRSIREETTQALECLTQVHYMNNDGAEFQRTGNQLLELAEDLGPSPILSRANALACVLQSADSRSDLARASMVRATEQFGSLEDPSDRSFAMQTVGLCAFGMGEWDRSLDLLGQALGLAESVGDQRRAGEALHPLAMMRYQQGDFRRAAELAVKMHTAGLQRGLVQEQIWGLSWEVASLLPANFENAELHDRISTRMMTMEGILAQEASGGAQMSHSDKLLAHGLLGQAHARRGAWSPALDHVETIHHLLVSRRDVICPWGLAGCAWGLDALLIHSDWALAQSAATLTPPEDRKLELVKVLEAGAARYPATSPAIMLRVGTAYRQSNQLARAQQVWTQALPASEGLGMRYCVGMIHLELGRQLPGTDPARGVHLSMALAIFAQLGATWNLARTQALLDQP